MRRKGSAPNTILRKLEPETKRKGYSTKLFMHYQFIKKPDWFAFPPFAIDKDHVMQVRQDGIEVFGMGKKRSITLFERRRTSF